MNTVFRAAAFAAALTVGLTACDDDEDSQEIFRATLSGANEVPTRNTSATGTAEFRVNDDNTISYPLDVTGLSNITAGHIHGPAPATENAAVIIGLFSAPPATSPFTGRLG